MSQDGRVIYFKYVVRPETGIDNASDGIGKLIARIVELEIR